MYGYLRTHVPELKVREQEYYRAVYCGLCRTMGKCTGQCSRMTLSYDFTFFALVRMALTGETVTVGARRCAVHPTRRRPMVEPNQALTLSAYLSAILAYHKVRDDLRDERGLKRTAASAISPFVSAMRRKAIRRGYGEVDMQVYRAMRALSELEAARPASVDQPASLFGELMAALLAHGLEGNTAKLAQTIGLHVGRWIYILDAADDFAEDLKYNRYNPLACLYRHMLEADPTLKELPPDTRETLRLALLSELTQLEMAFDLLSTEENPDLGGLLSNLLYLGMPREAERILFGEDGTESSSLRRRKSAGFKS
ncbi:MAG: hypothetical protein IJD38_05585 [Clostridia bacterium]|nr:hypothetical protein [Clostridia bacterium]